MHVYIQWDEQKRRTNLHEHGVDFAGLMHFFDGELLTQEDARYEYRETRFQSVGMAKGVMLYVVWTPADADGSKIHLISARKATPYETKAWFQYYSAPH